MAISTKDLMAVDYLGRPDGVRQGRKFVPWDCFGYATFGVLPHLIGKPWDDYALSCIHALRPTRVRVVDDGGTQMDAELWRVTVHINASTRLIECVMQEVVVGHWPTSCERA